MLLYITGVTLAIALLIIPGFPILYSTFGATQLCPSVISFLKFLIEKGADLHTVGLNNRGAFISRLRPPPKWGA